MKPQNKINYSDWHKSQVKRLSPYTGILNAKFIIDEWILESKHFPFSTIDYVEDKLWYFVYFKNKFKS